MIIAVLKDGLGNQLFQYAASRCLAEKRRVKLKLDVSEFKRNTLRDYSLHHFNITAGITSDYQHLLVRIRYAMKRQFAKLGLSGKNIIYQQNGLHFDEQFFKLGNWSCIEGYWQSEKYFTDIAPIIRNEFVLKNKPDYINSKYLDKIQTVNSVCLHVRRGDYVSVQEVNMIHGVCSLQYYADAIAYIDKHVDNPHFFVFSDDMAWSRANLKMGGRVVEYIDHNQQNAVEDLRLMSACKHNIIANSSFSWWGAWLNKNPDKIIVAPFKWFSETNLNIDILPDSWVKL
jgi:virulence-associated protein VapD